MGEVSSLHRHRITVALVSGYGNLWSGGIKRLQNLSIQSINGSAWNNIFSSNLKSHNTIFCNQDDFVSVFYSFWALRFVYLSLISVRGVIVYFISKLTSRLETFVFSIFSLIKLYMMFKSLVQTFLLIQLIILPGK